MNGEIISNTSNGNNKRIEVAHRLKPRVEVNVQKAHQISKGKDGRAVLSKKRN